MAQVQLSSIPGLSECRQWTGGDPEICVAVIDSRVDLSHACFSGADLREIMPVWLQSRMRPAGASHGTHVASVIFGQPGEPPGGIAPRCRGIIIPVYGESEEGELLPCGQDDLARAIALALEAGAHLINISGGELIKSGEVDPFLEQAIRSCERQDVVVVAATGNNGCECLHAPALLTNVLAVGAADASGQPLAFSNWDETLASHGILAPGQAILGAVPGGGVAANSGTSFACPVVTGVAALLLSLQKLRGRNPSPTTVRNTIIASAIPCGPEEQTQCVRMLGGRIRGKTALFFGTGALGGAVAACLRSIGVRCIGFSRSGEPNGHFDGSFKATLLREWLPQADFLVVAAPLTDETRGVIGGREIALLPARAGIVNPGACHRP